MKWWHADRSTEMGNGVTPIVLYLLFLHDAKALPKATSDCVYVGARGVDYFSVTVGSVHRMARPSHV